MNITRLKEIEKEIRQIDLRLDINDDEDFHNWADKRLNDLIEELQDSLKLRIAC